MKKALLAMPLILAGCAASTGVMKSPPPLAGDRYVAMGSSFAAGPGLPPEIEGKTDRCTRSSTNYAHLLAGKLSLNLTDVSCSGATTAHVLGGWNELPPQIDAVTADTQLVTITIGGNDVGYIGGLIKASMCTEIKPMPDRCQQSSAPDEQAWSAVEQAMRAIVTGVRHRAPHARVIFVDYLTILPDRGTCTALAFPAEQADAARAVATRLSAVTARAAAAEGAETLRISAMSRTHGACDKDGWANGWRGEFDAGGVRFHPNKKGMTAIAAALEQLIVKGTQP